MKTSCVLTAIALLTGAAAAYAEGNPQTLVVTASNATNNQLLVYNTSGALVQMVPTGGQGGASGNAGGIAAQGSLVAVVNFGSQNVAIFETDDHGFTLSHTIHSASKPLSVAFGKGHLYVLGTTTVESHRMDGSNVRTNPDGIGTLLLADGSAAQVGVLSDGHLIITEKTNVIETVGLDDEGAVTGIPVLVQNIPTNVNAPFGLITRGDDAYVTIAHADEISLIRKGTVLTVVPSGTGQHAPCWLALVGPFLYSSNSPSMSISRFAVYGQKIVQDGAVAATLNGAPTDIASGKGLVAVIDGAGAISHLSIFDVDEDGNLTLHASATISSPINGVAIVSSGKGDE